MHSVARRLHFASLIVGVAFLVALGVKPTDAQPAPIGPPTKSNLSEVLHGKKLVETNCATCHGVEGNSTNPQFPKIAGQNPDYLALQLHAFKSGARPSPIMSVPASALTNKQIDELAQYFSDQTVQPDVVKDPQLARDGAGIFNEPSAGTPPCVACHGRGGFGPGGMMGGHMGMMMGGHMGMMMGISGPVPNLYGQHASYILQGTSNNAVLCGVIFGLRGSAAISRRSGSV